MMAGIVNIKQLKTPIINPNMIINGAKNEYIRHVQKQHEKTT
jgi:hypothetical protein